MSKPKSKLEKKLTEEQQVKLADCLLAGMEYHVAIPWLKKEYGLSVSPSMLSKFWDKYCAPVILARQTRQFKVAKSLALSAEEQEEVQRGIAAALLRKASALLNQPNPPAEEIYFILSQALKVRDQDQKDRAADLKEQQVSLARDKFQFDAAEACLKHLATLKSVAANPALNQSAKIQEIRKIMFGVVPK